MDAVSSVDAVSAAAVSSAASVPAASVSSAAEESAPDASVVELEPHAVSPATIATVSSNANCFFIMISSKFLL